MSDLIKNADRKIKQAKVKLKNKAQKRGIWEDFGGKEIREFENQFLFKGDSFEETQKINQMIFDFSDWCQNFEIGE